MDAINHNEASNSSHSNTNRDASNSRKDNSKSKYASNRGIARKGACNSRVPPAGLQQQQTPATVGSLQQQQLACNSRNPATADSQQQQVACNSRDPVTTVIASNSGETSDHSKFSKSSDDNSNSKNVSKSRITSKGACNSRVSTAGLLKQ